MTQQMASSNKPMPRYPSKIEVRLDAQGNSLLTFGEHLSSEEYSFVLTPEATAKLAQLLVKSNTIAAQCEINKTLN